MTRFNFVKLVVDDLDSMHAFYAAAAGFVEQARFENADMEEILLRQEGSDFLFCLLRPRDGKPVGAAAAIGTIGFVTDDLGASTDRAIAAGATRTQPVIDLPGTKVALLADPEGNEIELVQFT